MRGTFVEWPQPHRREIDIANGEGFVVFPLGQDAEVRRADGTISPREFTYVEKPADPAAPVYVVECSYSDDDLPRVEAVHVIRRPGTDRDVRSADLYRLRSLEDVIEGAWMAASRNPVAVVGDPGEALDAAFERAVAARPAEMKRTIRGLRQRTRRRITPAVLSEVASVYRENWETGAPTKAVAEHFGVAPSTASLYVKRARDEGHKMEGAD